MRVLLLDFGRELRGGQRQVLYLGKALQESGAFAPVLAVPQGSPLLRLAQEQGLETLPVGSSFKRILSLLSMARRFRKGDKAEGAASQPGSDGGPLIIHTNDAHSAAFGARLAAKIPHSILVHTRRVSYPLSPGRRGEKYRRGDAVVGVSQEIAGAVVAGLVEPERIRVIHSGIDPALYPPRLPRDDGRLVFVCLGALTRQKGHAVLLDALTYLANKGLPQWELRIIGQGPLFSELLEQARSLGVESHLAFLGQQDSRKELRHCDIMIVPSVDGEGSSAVIKEAWATGLPVLCSDLRSNLELVRAEWNGLTFASGKAADLAVQMTRLSLDKDLQSRLVRGGAETLKNFTHQHMAEQYMALYQELALSAF